jgi:hypothetical protein
MWWRTWRVLAMWHSQANKFIGQPVANVRKLVWTLEKLTAPISVYKFERYSLFRKSYYNHSIVDMDPSWSYLNSQQAGFWIKCIWSEADLPWKGLLLLHAGEKPPRLRMFYTSDTAIHSMMTLQRTGQCLHLSKQKLQRHRKNKWSTSNSNQWWRGMLSTLLLNRLTKHQS